MYWLLVAPFNPFYLENQKSEICSKNAYRKYKECKKKPVKFRNQILSVVPILTPYILETARVMKNK